MSARIPSEDTVLKQRLASDPRLSAWVSANAGSGKTTVLSRRVIRLLLAGVDPSAILCLTFTKAAAANMQNRIFATLGDWALLEGRELARRVAAITGSMPDEAGLRRARQLFAAAIETPGGLKILTIHAFCERVLHLFPFEANVPARFTVLDDRASGELLAAARAGLILRAEMEPDGTLGQAMAYLTEEAAEETFDRLLTEITGQRETLLRVLSDKTRTLGDISRALDLQPEESVASIDQRIDATPFEAREWPALHASLREFAGKRLEGLAERVALAIDAPPDGRARAWRAIFLTASGAARAPGGFLTKDFEKQYPAYAALLLDELDRIAGLLERRKAAVVQERTHAMLTVADTLLGAYKAGKASRAALDFDDLIQATVSLLSRAGAEWVLYKLDRGIDHILVDEAQDTSPAQWDIVERLAHEFTAGAGARAGRRTIFAVGDEKQSIFSFQGAAPAEFARMRGLFGRKVQDAGERFEAIELKQSFRSTPDILHAVDIVFSDDANRRGLSSDDAAPVHETVRALDPGRVEVWPVEKPDPPRETLAWDAPFDETPATSPVTRLARKIAAEVRRLIEEGDPATGARYHAGDVMVLVRSRNALFEAVIRALKFAGVPVAGADRIVLTGHIAVMDLMALARFTLLPADDLTLATLLKTPLVGLDDDDLIRLAPGRTASLWATLATAAADDERLASAHRRLTMWLNEAAFKTPRAFFADILARDGGRRHFLARFGHEAADALDEFLRVAADYERANTASLQGFLAWLAEADAEIKRDLDVARGEVRVMTVHGAKGLEAKVVVLADTCGAPSGRHDPRLFWVQAPGRADGSTIPLWSAGKDHDPPCVAEARGVIRAANEAEYRRLLYVALTRAEDRLIVAGFEGDRARPAGNWYDMIETSLRSAGARVEPDGEGERLVYEPTPRRAVESLSAPERDAEADEPAWLRETAPQERVSEVTLNPSDEGMEETLPPGAEAVDPRILRRGALIHALLQYLPGVEVAQRPSQAVGFLRRAAPEWPEDHEEWAREALNVLALPELAALFAPGAAAEIALAGRIERPGRADYAVTGRIDRLAVSQERIDIVDFKTNRRPPETLAQVPQAYLRQIALYRHLLRRLYPDRTIHAALVWTAAARTMALPGEVMDETVRRMLDEG